MNKAKKVMLAAILVSACLITATHAGNNILANATDFDFAATLEPSVSIVIQYPTKPLTIELTSKGAFKNQDIRVTSYSNSDAGYVVTVSSPSTDLTAAEGNTIPTLSDLPGGYTTEQNRDNTFTTNRWGISVDNGNYFPASTSGLKIIDVSSGATGKAGVTNIVHLGAKLDMEAPTGTYETALNFTIVAKVPE